MQTATPDLEALAQFDFEQADPDPSPKTEAIPEPTEEAQAALANEMVPLEPIDFGDDEPIELETMSDRPFHKKPGPMLLASALAVGALGLGALGLLSAGQKDLDTVIAKNAESPSGSAAAEEGIKPDDPKDRTIGDLRSQEASRKLAEEMRKQEEERKRRLLAGRNGARPPSTTPTPAVRTSSVPDTDYSAPAERYSSASSYSPPSSYQAPSYASRYQPSASSFSGGGRSQSTPQEPPKPKKLLAFGQMPEDKAQASTQQSSPALQNASYQTVSYKQPSMGFGDNGDALKSQQAAFVSGVEQTRIQMGSAAKATISSGAIMPNRFLVTLDQALGSMQPGTQIIFEPRTVYPNGKVEAYAIGIARGGYQQIVPVPVGAIAVFATNGKILKAKAPSKGFFNSVGGQMLVGGLSGAASRFLATDSTTTVTDFGSQSNTKAGGKGVGDLGLSFLQGAANPLMQQIKPQQTDGKGEFSLEPGQALMVKVLQPFTF